jgi:alpha-amylase
MSRFGFALRQIARSDLPPPVGIVTALAIVLATFLATAAGTPPAEASSPSSPSSAPPVPSHGSPPAIGAPPAQAPALRGGPYTPSPVDWRDQSIYQIVTDRFFNGDPSNDTIEGSYNPSDGAQNHGGDWAGIEEKLDYIQGLGATALWISPVQTNAYAYYHGYGIRDFYGFAPHFGGLADLRSMVDAAHARGMYVILDVIANHGGDLVDSGNPSYPSFQNPGTYTMRWKNNSYQAMPPFNDLSKYHNNGHIQNFVDPDQILGELFGLDDFRTEDPTVRAELIAAHQWLVEQTDADGFRIDTVKHVELDFWQDFGPAMRSYATGTLGKSDFLMFGEVFDGSPVTNGLYTGTVGGGAFALDSVLWYPMYFTVRNVFREQAPTQWISFTLADSIHYEPGSTARNVTFLDNHDNGRFMGFASNGQGDDAKLRMALGWAHTSLGIPLVYYGTEQEFDGGGDPYNREDMWDGAWDFGPSEGDNFDPTAPMYRHIRRLNELRAALPSLRRGTQEDVATSPGDGIYAFRRKLAGEATVLVVLNTAASDRTLSFDPEFPAGTMTDGVTGREVVVPGAGTLELWMGARSAAVFTLEAVPSAPWLTGTWPPHDGTMRVSDGDVRLVFDRPMNESAVEAAVTVDPPVSWTPHWVGSTLALRPAGPWVGGIRYRVAVAGSASSAAGDPLGQEFAFEFETGVPLPGIVVPSGFTAHPVPGGNTEAVRALESGRPGTLDAGRLLVSDESWRRLLAVNPRGLEEAIFLHVGFGTPGSMAADVAGGQFGGDLLVMDHATVLRIHRDGAEGGRLDPITNLGGTATDFAITVDPTGAYGGAAFAGRPGAGTIWRIDGGGGISPFVTGLAGVGGLTFGPGGVWGTQLYALDTGGTLYRVDNLGALEVVASSSALAGSRSLAADPTNAFGGGLFTTHPGDDTVLRIDAGGSVGSFASGFLGFPGTDALAFDPLGNLAVVESDGGTHRIVLIVPDTSDSIATDIPTIRDGSGITFVGPNPFRHSTRIEFVVPDDGVGAAPSRLTVHDVAGRRIAGRPDRELPPGVYEWRWDGTATDGRPVPAGVYFVRLVVGAREWSTKLVRTR